MAKYIDREALIEWLKRIPLKDLSDRLGICRVIREDDFKKAIKNMPKGIIVDVSPVRHGRWIHERTEGGFHIWRCDQCGRGMNDNPEGTDLYCYHCGAKMDEGRARGVE